MSLPTYQEYQLLARAEFWFESGLLSTIAFRFVCFQVHIFASLYGTCVFQTVSGHLLVVFIGRWKKQLTRSLSALTAHLYKKIKVRSKCDIIGIVCSKLYSHHNFSWQYSISDLIALDLPPFPKVFLLQGPEIPILSHDFEGNV